MRRLNIPQISTGDMLREEIARKTSYGQEAKELMACGKFVDDAIVDGIVAEESGATIAEMDLFWTDIRGPWPQAETFRTRMRADDRFW